MTTYLSGLRSVVHTEGQDSAVSARRDTDKPARISVGILQGSTYRVGGTCHSESVSQSYQRSR